MKFTCSVEIDLPIEKVAQLFKDPDNLSKWQDGFVSMEHLSGNPGEPGAKSKLIYKTGGGKIELVETILTNKLPHKFSGKYEAKQMVNTMKSRFSKLENSKTKWMAELEYTEMNGFMIKLMAWLMPGIFKKQTQKWLDQFKAFAESQ